MVPNSPQPSTLHPPFEMRTGQNPKKLPSTTQDTSYLQRDCFPTLLHSVRLEVPNSPTENKGEILPIGHIDICQHLSSSSAHLYISHYPFFGIPKYPFHSTPLHSSPHSQLHQNHPRLPFLNNKPIFRSKTPFVHILPPFPFSNPSKTTLSYPSTQSLFYFGILHRCFYSFSVHSIITLTLFPTDVQTLIRPSHSSRLCPRKTCGQSTKSQKTTPGANACMSIAQIQKAEMRPL